MVFGVYIVGKYVEKYIYMTWSKAIMYMNMQIMPEVFILGCIHALPAYWELIRAEGPKHIPIFWEGH